MLAPGHSKCSVRTTSAGFGEVEIDEHDVRRRREPVAPRALERSRAADDLEPRVAEKRGSDPVAVQPNGHQKEDLDTRPQQPAPRIRHGSHPHSGVSLGAS